MIDKKKALELISSEMWDIDEWEPPYNHYSGDLLNDIQIGMGVAWNIYHRIEKMEEVEAIPIEWIKKWCNEEHNRKSLEERLLKRYGVLTLLEDWEKENERL